MLSRDARLPSRRITDLVTTKAGSDIIVYDQKTAAIHTLNDVAGSVWRTLDGTKSLHLVVAETGISEEIVRQAVTKLADANLLDGPIETDIRANQSRRDFMRKAAIGGAVAVPMLVSTTVASAQDTTSACGVCGEMLPISVYLDVLQPSTWESKINQGITNVLDSHNFGCSCGTCYATSSALSMPINTMTLGQVCVPPFQIQCKDLPIGVTASFDITWSGKCQNTSADPVARIRSVLLGGPSLISSAVKSDVCNVAGSDSQLLEVCRQLRPANVDEQQPLQRASVNDSATVEETATPQGDTVEATDPPQADDEAASQQQATEEATQDNAPEEGAAPPTPESTAPVGTEEAASDQDLQDW